MRKKIKTHAETPGREDHAEKAYIPRLKEILHSFFFLFFFVSSLRLRAFACGFLIWVRG